MTITASCIHVHTTFFVVACAQQVALFYVQDCFGGQLKQLSLHHSELTRGSCDHVFQSFICHIVEMSCAELLIQTADSQNASSCYTFWWLITVLFLNWKPCHCYAAGSVKLKLHNTATDITCYLKKSYLSMAVSL